MTSGSRKARTRRGAGDSGYTGAAVGVLLGAVPGYTGVAVAVVLGTGMAVAIGMPAFGAVTGTPVATGAERAGAERAGAERLFMGMFASERASKEAGGELPDGARKCLPDGGFRLSDTRLQGQGLL